MIDEIKKTSNNPVGDRCECCCIGKGKRSERIQQEQAGNNYIPSTGGNVVSGNGYFTHPCPGMSYQSSYFGEIRPYEVGGHKGHDYAAAVGTPTYAAAAGTVVIAGFSYSAGNWVVINHGNGLVTKYMHHSALGRQSRAICRERSADRICGKHRAVNRTASSFSGGAE